MAKKKIKRVGRAGGINNAAKIWKNIEIKLDDPNENPDEEAVNPIGAGIDLAFNVDFEEPPPPDDKWKEGKEQAEIDAIENVLNNQRLNRVRFRIREKRRKQNEKQIMNSLVNKRNRSIFNVDYSALWSIFTGVRQEFRVSFGTKRIMVGFDDILIAYNGKYRTLLEFAEIYDNEEGEFPIKLALRDAAIEALNKISPRKNKSTNKDKYLNAIYATPTNAPETKG